MVATFDSGFVRGEQRDHRTVPPHIAATRTIRRSADSQPPAYTRVEVMMHKVEQLPRYQTDSGWRKTKRFIKRLNVRALRRLGKIHLEDAPKKVSSGWCD